MRFFFISFACAATIFSSCQKNQLSEYQSALLTEEESEQSVLISPPTVGKIQLLTREVSFNSLNPSLKQIREFKYDESNRCIKIIIGTIDSSGNVVPALNVSRTLVPVYEGASSLPFKVQSVRTVFPNLVTEFFFRYDTKGNKISDSVRVLNQLGQPADRVVKYTYLKKDSIYSTPEFVNFPLTNNSFDTMYYFNYNIQKLRKYTVLSTGVRINEFVFDYDKNINPYGVLNIFNSLFVQNPALGIALNVPVQSHYLGLNRNNITGYIVDGIGRFTINYSYDDYKYPVWSEAYPEGAPNKLITYYFYQ